MITALTWVPRGAAKRNPLRFEMSVEEMARIKDIAREEADDEALNEQEEEEESMAGGFGELDIESEPILPVDNTPLPDNLDMDNYDEDAIEEDDEEDDELQLVSVGDNNMMGAMDDVNEQQMDEDEDDDDASGVDQEDNEVLDTDKLLVVAITEDEYSHLEVQLLSDDGSLFVHHDISLPDFPLCLSWLDTPPYRAEQSDQQVTCGNFMAVGTFSPAIEIWNLDVLDPLEPTATLGGVDESASLKATRASKKKAQKKGKKGKDTVVYKDGSHEAAVMSLSWNQSYRQALASGSADCTVKVWDVTTQQCSHTFNHHEDKVQAVQWHPQGLVLATAAFDKTVCLCDCRVAASIASYGILADIESLKWDPHNDNHLYACQEDGTITCIDMRQSDEALFSFQAHDSTVSGISFSAKVPGMLSTCSVDKTVRVWDVNTATKKGKKSKKSKKDDEGVAKVTGEPKMVAYKSMNVGKLFTIEYSADEMYTMATAGDKGMVAVWESDELGAIEAYFKERTTAADTSTS